MATRQPFGQQRNQFGRDWGNYAGPTNLPNCSAWGGANTVGLEAGDTAYVTTATAGRYHCVSAGTPGVLDAVWEQTGPIPPHAVLYDMPIAVGSVGTPVFVRDEADLPLAPASAASAPAVVNIQAGPALDAKALRLACAGGLSGGGWLFPVNTGPLPPEGFIIEVFFSGMDANNIGGFLMPLAEFTGVTVQGFAVNMFSQLYNASAELRIATATYSQWFNGPSFYGWPSAPTQVRCDKGPFKQTIELRKKDGQTPACWQVTQTLESPDGQYVVASAVSGVSNPIASFDGKTYSAIAIGPWVPTGYTPPASLDIQSLRILALGP